jgi:opacity protein-like surface antigen
MKSWLTVCLVASVAACSTYALELPLDAQLQAGASLGLPFAGDTESADIAPGVHVVYKANEKLGIEAGLTLLSDDASDSGASVDLDITALTVGGRAYLPLENDQITAYGTAGLGIYMPDISTSESEVSVDADNAVGFFFGAGAEYELNSSWRLFADLRYTIVDFDFTVKEKGGRYYDEYYGYYYSEGGDSMSASADYDHAIIRFGASFTFE